MSILLIMGMTMTANYTYGAILHEVRTKQVVTKGAVHINDKLLMSKGWRNVNILKVDLSDSNILVAPIESATGVQRQTILDMVNNSGAVAGINADYFDMGTSNTPSLGMLIKDGSLSHGYNSNYSTLGINKNMATFMINNDNMPMMDYYGVTLRIHVNGNLIGAAGTKNNIQSSITRPIIIDSTYYQTTNNIVSAHPTVYTIVVEDQMVTYKSLSGEKVTIPENGYVIIVPESLANTYYNQIKEGDIVEVQEMLYLNNGITEAVNSMKLGIGGSGIIMRNGEAYKGAAHAVSPKSNVARTIIATVKGTNEILLITIDNSSGYVGIGQSELVELLKRYGVQDAMYFDGGGSTTFVARNEGTTAPVLQNHPSDGSQRKVINGLGVFTTSAPGSIVNLTVTPESSRTFVGEQITLNLKGTDENSNPVTIDPSMVTFSVEGGTGDFLGNTFTPTSSGKMLIVASYKGVNHAVEIQVAEKPLGIYVEPSLVQLNEGASKTVQVYGVDQEGYKIPLKADSLTWTSSNRNIQVSNNTVTALAKGVEHLTVDYKGITGNVGVIVGSAAVPLESFESNLAKWAGTNNAGTVFASTDVKYHGEKSLKMTYTFKPSSDKQVAYTVLDTPITVVEDANSINLWLNGKKQGHSAKLEVVDSLGKTFDLKLTDNIDFSGWKYLSASLPEDLVLPAQVTKFYVSANSVSEEVTTAVYIDHVSMTRGFRQGSGLSAREDYLFDPYYKETLQDAIGGQYIINVVGQTKADSMLLGNESISQMSQKLANGASMILKASSKNSQLNLAPTSYTYNNTYQSGAYGNTKFIMLGTDSGGLRTTDENGWANMKAAIANSSEAKNLIIIMSKNPLTQFSDALEGKAVHNYLKEVREATGQNIFVFYAGGTEPEVCIEDGIRYMRTNGISVATDNYQDGSFIKFKIDGDAVYYTIEKFK